MQKIFNKANLIALIQSLSLIVLVTASSKDLSVNHRVAIIGAGPAGLIAAKSCIDKGITPTIFEASNSIGGIWSTANKRTWKSLHTNLSKFTCSFSDVPWKEEEALFPSQAAMNKYLVNYADKHNLQSLIRLNSPVHKVSKTAGSSKFTVTSGSLSSKEEFDEVIVASGFFSKPNDGLNNNIAVSGANSDVGGKVRVLSSEEYHNPRDFEDKVVVVVGGSFSGVEIVADISKRAKKVYHVIPRPFYVISKMLPQNLSDPATPFVAADLLFFDLNPGLLSRIQAFLNVSREEEVENLETLFRPAAHRYYQAMMGSHLYRRPTQNPRSKLFLHYPHEDTSPYNDNDFLKAEMMRDDGKAFVGISEDYRTALHNSNKVQLIAGRVTKIKDDMIYIQPPTSSSSSSAGSSQTAYSLREILAANKVQGEEKIDAVITCTGFHPNFSFLDSELLQPLEYRAEDSFQPLILYKDMWRKETAGLYFVGMYRGPFFGVMEQQARYVAGLIAGDAPFPSEVKYERELDIARQIRDQSPRPQFPHGDYLGLLFDLARETRQPLPSAELIDKHRTITPFTFSSDSSTRDRVNEEIQRQRQEQDLQGRNIPQVIINHLEGRSFHFDRQIHNRLDNSLATVRGTISFERIPSMPISEEKINEMCSTCSIKNPPAGYAPSPSSSSNTANKADAGSVSQGDECVVDDDRVFLLYRESGMIELPSGQSFEVNQHYIYHFHKERNSVEVFFARRDNVQVIDYHFLSLQFERREGKGWVGHNLHPCVKDMYNAEYVFSFQGLEINKMSIDFHVNGPSKDYSSLTQLWLL